MVVAWCWPESASVYGASPAARRLEYFLRQAFAAPPHSLCCSAVQVQVWGVGGNKSSCPLRHCLVHRTSACLAPRQMSQAFRGNVCIGPLSREARRDAQQGLRAQPRPSPESTPCVGHALAPADSASQSRKLLGRELLHIVPQADEVCDVDR
jgi:hypothetical protein